LYNSDDESDDHVDGEETGNGIVGMNLKLMITMMKNVGDFLEDDP